MQNAASPKHFAFICSLVLQDDGTRSYRVYHLSLTVEEPYRESQICNVSMDSIMMASESHFEVDECSHVHI